MRKKSKGMPSSSSSSLSTTSNQEPFSLFSVPLLSKETSFNVSPLSATPTLHCSSPDLTPSNLTENKSSEDDISFRPGTIQSAAKISIDADELVLSSESAHPFDSNNFMDAMLDLVLECFKDGYIAPYALFKQHFVYLNAKNGKSNFSYQGEFFNQEVDSIINDEMDLLNKDDRTSKLLNKLASVNFSALKEDQRKILNGFYRRDEDEDEVFSPVSQQQLSIDDDGSETMAISLLKEPEAHTKEIMTILELLQKNEFDEATYRSKQYYDQYKLDHNKIFHIKVSGSNINAIVLHFKAYTALAVELFEKKSHLSFALYAMRELWKYHSYTSLKSIQKDLQQIALKLDYDLIKVIRKNGPDFYNKIKAKLTSEFAKKQLSPQFYVILDDIFKDNPDKGAFSQPGPFMFKPKTPTAVQITPETSSLLPWPLSRCGI